MFRKEMNPTEKCDSKFKNNNYFQKCRLKRKGKRKILIIERERSVFCCTIRFYIRKPTIPFLFYIYFYIILFMVSALNALNLCLKL